MAILPALLPTILLLTLVQAIPTPLNNSEDVSRTPGMLKAEEIVYRLPSEVKPTSYKIKLTPNLVDFTYEGESEIQLQITSRTKTIIMHAVKPINFVVPITVTCVTDPTVTYYADKFNWLTKQEFIEFPFEKLLPTGSCKLKLAFEGVLNDQGVGFYRSNYTNSDNKIVSLATTHFEPVGARRAFPCFDEPELKAKFSISIQHPSNYHAISNTHALSTQIVGGNPKIELTTFAETPVMSTYLVAFAVSDFEKLENKELDFRVWARENAIHKGKYALEIGPDTLKELETYTGITQKSSGFAKMDCIAVPHLNAGAMENWGLVTYSEKGLLFEENVSTTSDKEGILTIVAHEFAHQWFGNLVSPKWWTWVWLNEGFANYFQYLISDKIDETWRLMDLLVIKSIQGKAFPTDSKSTAVAMNHEVQSPSEISDKFNKFGSITYSKAGAVIRMISHVLNETVFQKGIRAYLSNNKYKSADSDTLFLELQKVYDDTDARISKVELKSAFDNWATTPGFPVITVTRDYKKKIASVTKKRFLYEDDETVELYKYWVPLNYAQSERDFSDTTVTAWSKPDEIKTEVTGLDDKKWAIFNKQQFGYYRVNYDTENWNLIIKTLLSKNFNDIHVLNRAQLIDDSMNLARIGALNYTVALKLVSYLENEQDYVPWNAAFRAFEHLNKMLANTAYSKDIKTFILGLTDNLEKDLMYNATSEDKPLTKYQRISVQTWACKLGSETCRNDAHTKLDKWLTNSTHNPIPKDQKSVILCEGVRNADQTKWSQLFEKYLQDKKNNPEDEDPSILKGLGCTSNTGILMNFLNQTMNKTAEISDHNSIISSVCGGSEEGINVVLAFLSENYVELSKMFTGDELLKFFTNLGSYVTTQANVDKLKELAKMMAKSSKDIKTAIEKEIATAQKNVEWVIKVEGGFEEFFRKENVPEKDNNSHDNDSHKNSVMNTVSVSTILLVTSFVISRIY